jgi:hypothetical protein
LACHDARSLQKRSGCRFEDDHMENLANFRGDTA